MKKNPADYVIGPDATIEDADLDEREIYHKGERLTEARAAELGDIAAREAEQTRTARTAGLIPGGKSLSGGQKHSPVVQVRVSEITRTKLEAIAKARKMSVSKLSRQVLDEFVNRETA
ncbi:hypothetical protein MHEI_22910 [Mycobacterium heidelbergense]|nr:DNA-binding protein [Mycobacterium heidelbergense]BBZ50574.1 hypothetical protein MHEI_22910 [Mycobacterium heidelbergense]